VVVIDTVVMWLDRHRRCVHDIVARTKVVVAPRAFLDLVREQLRLLA